MLLRKHAFRLRRERIGYDLAGIGLFLLAWQILSVLVNDIIVASPLETLESLFGMIQDRTFWKTVGMTLERFGWGLLLGSGSGFAIGLIAGLEQRIRRLFEPLRWAIMSTPPVVMVTVGMIWFGMGAAQTIFVTAILIVPIMYVNTIEGIEAVDRKLVEMGRVYKVPFRMLLQDIYLPGIGGSVLAGFTLAAGLGIRIVVLAEVLGALSGIGYEFSVARRNLETPTLFAWVIVCLLLIGLLELGILNPVKAHIMKWRKEAHSDDRIQRRQ